MKPKSLKTIEELKVDHAKAQKKWRDSLSDERKLEMKLKHKIFRDASKLKKDKLLIQTKPKTEEQKLRQKITFKNWYYKNKELGNKRKSKYYPNYYIKNKIKINLYNNKIYLYKKEVKRFNQILI